jgi:IclR family mhp operon transcriptional activator
MWNSGEGEVVRCGRDGGVQSVARAFEVIEALNRRPVTTLDALHALTGLPKPTLVRLLATLAGAGYVYQVSRREGYALTERVLRLTAGLRQRDVLADVARPVMEAFTREQKWQVSLACSDGDAMLVRHTTRDISPFSREQTNLNRRIPMLLSAVGRAYFAFCSDREREVIVGLLAAASDPYTQGDGPARMAAIVEKTRRNGYATIRRPRTNPTHSFAVPVLAPGAGEAPLGGLTMFYYRSCLTEAQATERFLAPLRAAADEIARRTLQARACAATGAVSQIETGCNRPV